MKAKNVINLLDNKEFEYLYITFRDLMDLKVPRKYVYELKFTGEPEIVTQHFENSYPEQKPIDVDFVTLNDVTIVLNRNYCTNLYSINGSDEFSPVKKGYKGDYTAEKAILRKSISYFSLFNKDLLRISPHYYVMFENNENFDSHYNTFQENKITQDRITIKIKEENL